MFDYLIVYPAAVFLGFLVGLLFPRWGRRGTLTVILVSGLPGAVLSVFGALAYLDMVGVARLFKEMALPAALICYALGLFGGLVGIAVRSLVGGIIRTRHLRPQHRRAGFQLRRGSA